MADTRPEKENEIRLFSGMDNGSGSIGLVMYGERGGREAYRSINAPEASVEESKWSSRAALSNASLPRQSCSRTLISLTVGRLRGSKIKDYGDIVKRRHTLSSYPEYWRGWRTDQVPRIGPAVYDRRKPRGPKMETWAVGLPSIMA